MISSKNSKSKENKTEQEWTFQLWNLSHFILFYTYQIDEPKKSNESTYIKYIDCNALFMAHRQSVVDFID